ncbi:hypothetical protein MNL08_06985 [Bartonella krasnovii]|uniref:hypothetical protein n=1 Tax=Bartonella krasnovii TaxID=2267275 RepID=UPI001F4CCB76|nr:hypothetical protein [Bartonella krasnovii]UNF41902.1 hypothetical protein MNL08_06985 [Bartonella krasnovii]UNF55109.1 hypothetical protein MNL00_07005 [Bartonella krasnovii]
MSVTSVAWGKWRCLGERQVGALLGGKMLGAEREDGGLLLLCCVCLRGSKRFPPWRVS